MKTDTQGTQAGAIHSAMAGILIDVGGIAKDRKNTQQGFQFRGIDDVYNALHEVFAKHGVYMTTDVLTERSEERETKSGGTLIYRILMVKFTFHACDGSEVASTVMGEAMDSGDKAANKAMAIAHKYALLQAFAIPTQEEKDPDGGTPPESRSKTQKGHNVPPPAPPPPKQGAEAQKVADAFDSPALPEGCPNPDVHCPTMAEQIEFIRAAVAWLAAGNEDDAIREWSKFTGPDKKNGGEKEFYLTLKNLDNPKDTWGKWIARVYGTAKEKVQADIALSAGSAPKQEAKSDDGLPF